MRSPSSGSAAATVVIAHSLGQQKLSPVVALSDHGGRAGRHRVSAPAGYLGYPASLERRSLAI
jgi:hypothetical protein